MPKLTSGRYIGVPASVGHESCVKRPCQKQLSNFELRARQLVRNAAALGHELPLEKAKDLLKPDEPVVCKKTVDVRPGNGPVQCQRKITVVKAQGREAAKAAMAEFRPRRRGAISLN